MINKTKSSFGHPSLAMSELVMKQNYIYWRFKYFIHIENMFQIFLDEIEKSNRIADDNIISIKKIKFEQFAKFLYAYSSKKISNYL